MSQLHAYIDAWRRHDIAGVLATLTEDCVVIECYGPVYHGRGRVDQWMHAGSVLAAPSITGRSSRRRLLGTP